MLRALFGFEPPLSRRRYVLTGLTLAALKYCVDAGLVWGVTRQVWLPFDYLISFHSPVRRFSLQPLWLFWLLAVWTLPFLWLGVSLTMRRARDAGRSPWWGLGFFLPVLNYGVLLVFAILPSSPVPTVPPATGAPLVQHDLQAALVGVLGGVMFALAMLGLQVYVLRSYGLALFFGTPVVMGAIAGYVLNRGHPRSASSTTLIACAAVAITGGAILLFALEGAVCIIMALPLAAAAATLGSAVARSIVLGGASPRRHAAIVLLGLPMASGVEAWRHPPAEYEVVSSVVVNAPPEQVWPHVIAFPALPEPTEWLFRTGIAYPIGARIEGSGVGALRRCDFTTGPFVEPITAWDAPRRLAFSVAAQPDPMQEWSPYRHIRPPHLDGYFRSVRGEFRLRPLPGGRTLLEGSTWYVLEMAPVAYWRLGAEPVLHAIHARVLDHVKRLAEAPPVL